MTGRETVLALETSGAVGSVAVAVDGQVRARAFLGEPSGHAARLLPAVDEVLRSGALTPSDLEAVIVGSGPGSFTGVRVSAASAKGLAHALRIHLIPVSSLLGAALTEDALPSGVGPWDLPSEKLEAETRTRCVLFDARGDRVFTAAYRLTEGAPDELRAPTFARLPDVLSDEALMEFAFCGEGAARHAGAIEAEGGVVLSPPAGMPSADGLVRAFALSASTMEPWDLAAWEPDYLRASNAEREQGGR